MTFVGLPSTNTWWTIPTTSTDDWPAPVTITHSVTIPARDGASLLRVTRPKPRNWQQRRTGERVPHWMR